MQGGQGFDPYSGKIIHAMGHLSPGSATTEAHTPRACALQQATAMRSPRTTRVAPAHHN